jgi:hypothetical protein
LTETRRNDISKALFNLLKDHEVLFREKNKKEFLKAEFYLKLANLASTNNENALTYYKKALSKKATLVFDKVSLKIILRSLKVK